MRGQIDHFFADGSGLIEAAQGVQQQALVVSSFEILGRFGAGLTNRDESVFVLALTPENLTDVNHDADIFRVGLEQIGELLERLVELIVIEQSLGQSVARGQVIGLKAGGAAIGGDGLPGLLQLLISRAQCIFHLG